MTTIRSPLPFALATLAALAPLAAQSSLPLPNAVVHDPTPGTDTTDARIHLWFHTDSRMLEMRWSGSPTSSGNWSYPSRFVRPSSSPPTGVMPMVAWTDRWGRRRFNGFYKADRYTIDTPYRYSATMRIGQFTSSFLGWFRPMAAFTWKNGSVGRINMFGATGATGSIHEAWWDGYAWRHSFITTPAGIGPMKMGPHSALWHSVIFRQGFVYMLRDQRAADSHLFCYRWLNNGWSWWQIDKPRGVHKLRGVPVAVRTGVMHHSVFVVGENSDGTQELYERRFFALQWERDWIHHGRPYYRHSRGSYTPVSHFSVGAGVAYWDEEGRRHVRVFCTAPAANGLQGRMFERHVFPSGARVWSRHGVPSGKNAFASASAVVVDGDTWDTVHVFGRADDGSIWRRTISERNQGNLHTTSGWHWSRMF